LTGYVTGHVSISRVREKDWASFVGKLVRKLRVRLRGPSKSLARDVHSTREKEGRREEKGFKCLNFI